MDRCMADEVMITDYPDQDQRFAICNTQWEEKEKDSQAKPGELRAAPDYEPRICEETELRVLRDGDAPKIVGYAAVFNKKSENLGFFVEQIAPGAFKGAIKKSDARALFNHDPNIILGRQSNGTLKLKEDDKGLFMEVMPPDTQFIRDMVIAPIERGDITQQSFGFTVKIDQWEEDKEKQTTLRTIVEVDRLFDVSPVTFPAYPDTTVALRSMSQWQQKTKDLIPISGETPEGWEKITKADAAETRKEGELLVQQIKFMEVR